MAFPPDPIVADKAPGPPSSSTEHPYHHNDLATAINDTVAVVADHVQHRGYTYVRSEVNDGPPPTPTVGDTWFDPDVGFTYLRYDDGTTVVWMQSGTASSSGGVGGSGDGDTGTVIDGGFANSIYGGTVPIDGGTAA